MYDYSRFSFSNLNAPEYVHVKLIVFWPIYAVSFWLLEQRTGILFHPMYCALDSRIPFCEYFVILYVFWFLFVGGYLLYSFLFDVPSFKRMMWFIIVSYVFSFVALLLYPTRQDLRPALADGGNVFSQLVSLLYRTDTNTNVCPSLHVVGSAAVVYGAWNSSRFRTTGWRTTFTLLAALICLSTLFIKQHSVIDVLCGIAVSFLSIPIARFLELCENHILLPIRS